MSQRTPGGCWEHRCGILGLEQCSYLGVLRLHWRWLVRKPCIWGYLGGTVLTLGFGRGCVGLHAQCGLL